MCLVNAALDNSLILDLTVTPENVEIVTIKWVNFPLGCYLVFPAHSLPCSAYFVHRFVPFSIG
jgi:hypothetical protein